MTYLGIFTTSIFTLSQLLSVLCLTPSEKSDMHLTTAELASKNGYPAETHTLLTPDGYLLNMHRIPYSSKSPRSANKPAVLLHHGLAATSGDFVFLGPAYSLAYYLADEGFDVFMGNSRGNTYSKSHVNLTMSHAAFWNFSWHEMAIYDLPTEIDYILKITNQEQIFYVGMSMGTTMFFVLASERPEYNDKIKLMLAMGPVAYLNRSTPDGNSFWRFSSLALSVLYVLGIEGFKPNLWIFSWFAENVCAHELGSDLCYNMITGRHLDPANDVYLPLLPVIFAHFPGGLCVKTMIHFIQLYTTGNFEKWDYLQEMNLEIYKQARPPEYNLSAITAPVVLMYGEKDMFASRQEVLRLSRKLPNSLEVYKVPDETFTHMEFVSSTNAKSLVYEKILKLMKNK